jgi:hypothetical protein
VGGCPCGCPSVDFARTPGSGLHIRVDATVTGTSDGVFLYTVGDGRLGGIEWVSGSEAPDPDELPEPATLRPAPAGS